MRPAARVAAAAEVLDVWLAGSERMEAILRRWGRENRYAGSKDRRAIADIAYDCLRRRRSFGWLAGGAETGRALALGRVISEAGDLERTFTGEAHDPAQLTADEAARAAEIAAMGPEAALAEAPEAVRLDMPDWIAPSLRQSLGDDLAASMAALAGRAPVDLRVNWLKGDWAAAIASLAENAPQLVGEAVEGAPDAIRLPSGARVTSHPAYLNGLVELQDAASQAGAALAAPKPDETILDYCAGGGGKALAFASLTGGGARIVAHDVEPRRMADLPERAARAGAVIERLATPDLTALEGDCDLVFVDAPCSGSGTWRRDPESKWRLTKARLATLLKSQREALEAAVRYVKPGGRLAYATCSVLSEENEAQAAAFGQLHPDLKLVETRAWLPTGVGDGFFCAVFHRRSSD